MTLKQTAVLCTVAVAMIGTGVARADRNFSYRMVFQGSVHEQACIPSLDGRDNAGNDGVLALAPAAYAVGVQDFAIFLPACALAPQAQGSAWFYNSAAGAVAHGQLVKTGASGATWQYQLLAADAEQPLTVGVSPSLAPDNTESALVLSNHSRLNYRVRYGRNVGAALNAGGRGDVKRHAATANPAAFPDVADVTYVMYYH